MKNVYYTIISDIYLIFIIINNLITDAWHTLHQCILTWYINNIVDTIIIIIICYKFSIFFLTNYKLHSLLNSLSFWNFIIIYLAQNVTEILTVVSISIKWLLNSLILPNCKIQRAVLNQQAKLQWTP